jgi:predicted component of type VI protein secretion system
VLLRRFAREPKKMTELRAVIDNLNRLLNTKKGFGSWLTTFGIGDYNMYRARDKIVTTLLSEIQENVRLFEPRARIDKIAEVPTESPFRIKFQMSGFLLETQRPIFVVVDSLKSTVTVES